MMMMRTFCFQAFLVLSVCLSFPVKGLAQDEVRKVINLREGWTFYGIKGEGAISNEIHKNDFSEPKSQNITIPHDWAVAELFNKETSKNTEGWYRTSFKLPSATQTTHWHLALDGVAGHLQIWLNGKELGQWENGYIPRKLDLTDSIEKVGQNILVIRIKKNASDAHLPAGLIRPMKLIGQSGLRVIPGSLQVAFLDTEVSKSPVKTTFKIQNNLRKKFKVKLTGSVLQERSKRAIAELEPIELEVDSGEEKDISLAGQMRTPLIWEPRRPRKYYIQVRIEVGSRLYDSEEIFTGVQSIKADAQRGFLIDDDPLPIKGVCFREEFGSLGAAYYKDAASRQLMLLQEIGCNAIRVSDYPPSPGLISLCDEIGIMVMIESQTQSEDEWREIVRAYRNHPSVVMWSLGQGEASSAKKLCEAIKSEDPTRPITSSAANVEEAKAISPHTDIIGINFANDSYKELLDAHDDKLILGTKTTATVSSRDYYATPLSQGPIETTSGKEISSYNLHHLKEGCTPTKELTAQNQYAPRLIGQFVESAFDYLQPASSSKNTLNYTGIYDFNGFRKSRADFYQCHWRPKVRSAFLTPHWSLTVEKETPVTIHAYTTGEEAELFIGEKSLGKKKIEEGTCQAIWENIPYQPGKLQLQTYKNGRKWAAASQQNAGKASELILETDKSRISANKDTLIYISAIIADKNGNPIYDTDQEIAFEIEGQGRIIATSNGNPLDKTPFASTKRKTYRGKALVIIQPTEKGQLTLLAQNPKLGEAKRSVLVKGSLGQ